MDRETYEALIRATDNPGVFPAYNEGFYVVAMDRLAYVDEPETATQVRAGKAGAIKRDFLEWLDQDEC